MNQVRVKITSKGKIKIMKTMFEVIEMAQKIWEHPYENKNFEFGKAVVLFKDKDCNAITYVIHSLMPMPYYVESKDDFNKTYSMLRKTLEEQNLHLIESKDGVYTDAPSDVKKEVIAEMKNKGYNTKGVS